ncbi:hypothetical protein [Faecalispora jeddahensis]|uniref:hypothetical protein n=1 Tax=Faecalispora jeddahensis TaxID=1414721 RepID=UPI001899B634|nr:hypothetical protein [Faecalispora jeddahensis]MBE6743128.1 hypothetical protein [Oscillospiraceae bacterium]
MPAVTALEASTRLKAVNASMSFQLMDFDVQENANRTAAFYIDDRTVLILGEEIQQNGIKHRI